MSTFEFTKTNINGVYLIESFIVEDNRGNFTKYFEKDTFFRHGVDFNGAEDFISFSTKYVIRGMHFQLFHPQKKLVNVIRGKVFDVVIDLRRESETYGKWQGFYLSANNRNSLLIPEGCAHGFISLSDESIVNYKCDGKYDKNTDTGICYNDPDIAVEWPIPEGEHIVISGRDKGLMTFAEFDAKCEFEYR